MRYVFLQTELLLNDGIKELSEYDIQSMIFAFFRSRQEKYGIKEATRESHGKTDIVVNLETGESIYLEIKTYFKKHESLKPVHFNDDLFKLANDINKVNSRAYFILAGTADKLTEAKIAKYDYLKAKRDKKRYWTTYNGTKPLKYSAKNKAEKFSIRIRPSHGEYYGKSRIWSWEVLPAK